jgi:hypothetical protein
MTMAPAFAFVMLAGHAAFVTTGDLDFIGRHRRRIVLGLLPGAVAGGASLVAHGALPEFWMAVKEVLLWAVLSGLLLVLVMRGRRLLGDIRRPRVAGPVAAGLVIVFVLSGLSPYTGLKYQHSAAMLSNLRVDGGCWNHVLIPEEVRLADHYVRIDDASLIREGAIPEYEALLEGHLWGPTLLQYTVDNWCKPSVRPIRIEGTFRGERVVVEDLCDGLGPDIGPYTTGGWLRFQKFLARECPQACIH